MIRDYKQLTHPDEAEKLLSSYTFSPEYEILPLREARGRVLIKNITCAQDSPPFDKAAMDGYAVRSTDDTNNFRILGTVAAGDAPSCTVGKDECVKIMTGAAMPEGADKVVRVEYTREEGGYMMLTQPEPSKNVIDRGSNHREGDTAMKPKRLTSRDIGILASYGVDSVPVAVPPQVAVIPTGSELQVPGKPLGPGQIYNSNSYQLETQVAETGCPCRVYDIAGDHPDALDATLAEAMATADVILLSGGVSMGDYDLVPGSIEKTGAEILLHGLAVKPGKPTLFAVKDSTYFFGMPGNPVSTFVIFEVFVKPFIYRMMGTEYTPRRSRGIAAERIARKSADRVEFLPVLIEQGLIQRLPYHGSANLDTLGRANALLRLEQGIFELPEGGAADVRLI